MQATFLLGPAGTGKTYRCLAEARAALKHSGEGLPLLFIAPKQATYQIERELLSDPELDGYTRLQILSFDRLARFVLASGTPARVLSEQGRVMLLRALLMRHQEKLRVFRGSARLPGFAQLLSDCLNELQVHKISPAQLLATAERLPANATLADKLHDLSLIFEAYLDALIHERLHDSSSLLELAVLSITESSSAGTFRCEALWLDGFAELTPQELALLFALIPACDRTTLAFCAQSVDDEAPDWLSTWAIAGQCAAKCYAAISALPGCEMKLEKLGRGSHCSRFANNPTLAHLEAHWSSSQPFTSNADRVNSSLRLVTCPNPEAEAVLAAREILRYVRAGGRYRDVGVILRDLSGYHDAIRRAFTRYEIPFFIDRREPIAHHPLAELTRSSLRLAAFDWQLEDWLAVLKTGLAGAEDSEIDRVESEALEHGWSGKMWQQPLNSEDIDDVGLLEKLRKTLVPPIAQFTQRLQANAMRASGVELARALHDLWEDLGVINTLQNWSREFDQPDSSAAIHVTVWEQMQDWLESLELAFGSQRLDLRDWIAIIDAGLANLTVGIVPPSLDQVLVGAVDRSRNPNLQLALVLGLNETVFPASSSLPTLLNEADRAALESKDFQLGASTRLRLGHERYLGYIACTRARERLVLSFASFDALDRKLNPSIFVSHLQQLFPSLAVEQWEESSSWTDAPHASDLLPYLIAAGQSNSHFADFPILERLQTGVERLRKLPILDPLTPAAAQALYTRELRTSITSLERFGQCPFKFFVHSGLRAQERKLFQVDRKIVGDFQHRVLKAFHDELRAERKRWRDITPADARHRIARITELHARNYHDGLFAASARQRFAARQLSLALQDFVEVVVGWMAQNQFDPEEVELQFGKEAGIPEWRLPLEDRHALLFRGSIDRVDLHKRSDGTALCVVVDFKSSARAVEPLLLHNGIQLQLPAYLSVLRHLGNPKRHFNVSSLIPAGFFYVSLRGSYERGRYRNEVLDERDTARRAAYQHSGRFDGAFAEFLDTSGTGDQFKQSGRSRDPMASSDFLTLLDQVDARLRDFGRRIFAGDTAVNPYRRSTETPCDFCDYQPICRIDRWSHKYRALVPAPKS